jgi:hypothetical protein
MAKRKVEAWHFAEDDGYGVSTKCTQEEAFEAIKAEMRKSDDGSIADTLQLADIEPSTLRKHRRCDVGTIGATECYDCGEPHNSAGISIFVWHRV